MVLQIWYFEARGRAEQLRVTLVCSGMKFQNKSVGNFFGWDKNIVPGSLDWGQVPAIHDTETGKTYVQSLAQLQWIGRKGGLLPKDVEDEYDTLTVLNHMNDIRTDLYGFFMKGTCWGAKSMRSAKSKLKKLDAKLGENEYFAAKTLTVADTVAFDLFNNMVETMSPGTMKEFNNLWRHYNTMLAREDIQTYLKSDLCYDPFPEIGFGGVAGSIYFERSIISFWKR